MPSPQKIQQRDAGGSCSMCTLSAPKGGRAAQGGGTVYVLTAQMTDRDGKYYARACAFSDGDDGCFDTLVAEQQFVNRSKRDSVTLVRELLGDDDDGAAVILEDLRL